MKRLTLEFYECEHQGDLDNYIADFPKGTVIISKSINSDAETGTVVIEVYNSAMFWDLFKETDTYGFLN